MRAYRNLRFLGRLGNQLFQYCYAKAYCDGNGLELRVEPWLGQHAFVLDDPAIVSDEPSDFAGYYQTQDDLIYTRAQARAWLSWRPDVVQALEHGAWWKSESWCQSIPQWPAVGHLRRGDYEPTVYVRVSEESYRVAAEAWIETPLAFVSEEEPWHVLGLPDWQPDFYLLAKAEVMFRANSTYSWWAHVLSLKEQQVFSPWITGMRPGLEHQDCLFVEGNWPRFAELPNVTDLRLPP